MRITANTLHAISSHLACSMANLVSKNCHFPPVFSQFSGRSLCQKAVSDEMRFFPIAFWALA